jgi:2,3-dihydroxybiphenyl 1,2-dioxygenase
MGVTKLAYAGANATDLDVWRGYVTDVLGLQIADEGGEHLLYVRADERHHRLIVHAADHDNVAYLGWELSDHAALEAAAAAVERQGVTVESGKPQQLADRHVLEMVHFTCPYSGVRMELTVGNEVVFMPAFRPSRALSGFRTAELGMGHAALYTTADVMEAARFYVRTLGFAVSDYEILPDGVPLVSFLHCNPRHHSLAFIAHPNPRFSIQHIMFETNSLDDLGPTYDLCVQRNITATSLGRHPNDRGLTFYFRNPSGWLFEYAWQLRNIDPRNWTAEQYVLKPGDAWGHEGLHSME